MKYRSYIVDSEGNKMSRKVRKAARKQTFAHNKGLHSNRLKGS